MKAALSNLDASFDDDVIARFELLLNELEVVEGEIFANVWRGDTIVRIEPRSGQVIGRIDLGKLHPESDRTHPENFPNGIAYDETSKRLFVTGKRWPSVFEIHLIRRATP